MQGGQDSPYMLPAAYLKDDKRLSSETPLELLSSFFRHVATTFKSLSIPIEKV